MQVVNILCAEKEPIAELLLAVVRDASAGARTLALVGHNPAVAELAVLLDDARGDPAAITSLRNRFPPGAVAIFDVPSSFADLGPGGATLTAFRTPDE